MEQPQRHTHVGLVLGLILVGMAARFLPHPGNMTPLVAMALFGATCLSRRWGVALPLAAVVLSDLAIGLHDVIAFTWGAFALTGVVGWWLRRQPTGGRMVLAALGGSTLFFLVTNFGVWLVGHQGTMYPKSLEGLWTCYVAALPFFRNMLIGDLVYTLGFFGLYAWALRLVPARSLAR